MNRILSSMVLAAIALLAWPFQTRAAESYDNCTGFIDSLPAVIGTQGNWCLRKDLSTAIASGAAITIATNNVTLDCNDFKIGGLAAGLETGASGVYAASRFNTTVRNCRIRGFRTGVNLLGAGGGHKIEDNSLEGSRSIGIFIAGAGSVVRGNRVIDSGGSTSNALAVESGIEVNGGVDVIDNRVSGVRPSADGARVAAGILAVNNEGGNIIGNRVSGLVTDESAGSVGILALGLGKAAKSVVSGNILKGSGSGSGTAIQCDGLASVTSDGADVISVDNVLLGFDTAINGCSPGSNSVNSN